MPRQNQPERINNLTFEEWLSQKPEHLTLPEVPPEFRDWPPAREFWKGGYSLSHAVFQYDVKLTLAANRKSRIRRLRKTRHNPANPPETTEAPPEKGYATPDA